MSSPTKPRSDPGMITYLDLIDRVTVLNPKAVVLEGLDRAVIGMTQDRKPLLIYGKEKCIEVIMKDNKMKLGDASDWLEHNTFYNYYGEYGPVFEDEYSDDGYTSGEYDYADKEFCAPPGDDCHEFASYDEIL